MTVIAWDGRMLAADKRSVCYGVMSTTTKIRRLETGEILAWSGNQDSGELLAKWYADGQDPTKWPECQKEEDTWSRLVVVKNRDCYFFERQPVCVKVEDPFRAWGSGRDFALAAMHLGKNAQEAVEIACLFETGCGNGVNSYIAE